MLESQLEAYFRKRCRLALGGVVVKIAPTLVGVPDRLVILPEGRIFLVELKTKSGRLSPAQSAFHLKVQKLGSPVYVLFGKEEVDTWVKERAVEAVPDDIDPALPPPPRWEKGDPIPPEPRIGSHVIGRRGIMMRRAQSGLWGARSVVPHLTWEALYLAHGPLEITFVPDFSGDMHDLPICGGCGFAMTSNYCSMCL